MGTCRLWIKALCAASLCAFVAGCEDKGTKAAPAKAAVVTPKTDFPMPPPPVARDLPVEANVAPARVHDAPTAGAESADALIKGLVDAAKKRDERAFLELTVSGKDVALHFHAGVQTQVREVLGRLPRKFATYIQQIPADAELTGIKPGLAIDFQKGQGAITPMPGRLSTDFTLKVGPNARTLPVGRIVQIGGKWKLLDF